MSRIMSAILFAIYNLVLQSMQGTKEYVGKAFDPVPAMVGSSAGGL